MTHAMIYVAIAIMVLIIINITISAQNRSDINDIQYTVNFIRAEQLCGHDSNWLKFKSYTSNNKLYKKMCDIETKLDAIDTAEKQIGIGEHFTYGDNQYVVEAVCSSTSIGNTPHLSVELVKGENVVIRG